MDTDKIYEILSTVRHPEFDNSIVTQGVVQNLRVDGDKISFSLVLPPNAAYTNSLKEACKAAITQHYPNAQVRILELVKQAPKPKPQQPAAIGMDKVDKIIAIASGKGGVGKSTISVNLAVCLAQMGYRVGLIDADLYGPSIPKMFGMEDAKPSMTLVDEHELIDPVERYGVKLLSIGFFVNPDDPLIWRGPMAISALRQLTKQGNWGELDFLLIDLPPGTGDIHLSVTSEIKLSGAIVVSTPQAVALADVVKGINMFKSEKIEVPVIGLVENMAWFTPAELPDNKYYIFGKDGCKELAEKLNIPLLGQIPLVQGIREGGDNGAPISLQNSISGNAFKEMAVNFIAQL